MIRFAKHCRKNEAVFSSAHGSSSDGAADLGAGAGTFSMKVGVIDSERAKEEGVAVGVKILPSAEVGPPTWPSLHKQMTPRSWFLAQEKVADVGVTAEMNRLGGVSGSSSLETIQTHPFWKVDTLDKARFLGEISMSFHCQQSFQRKNSRPSHPLAYRSHCLDRDHETQDPQRSSGKHFKGPCTASISSG